MSDEKEKLLEEIKRLNRRLAAYETVINRVPAMCEELAASLENTF